MNKSELKPAVVFEQFAKINEIPRPSKHEEKMIEYLKSWGESHHLETLVDETGNVIISVVQSLSDRNNVLGLSAGFGQGFTALQSGQKRFGLVQFCVKIQVDPVIQFFASRVDGIGGGQGQQPIQLRMIGVEGSREGGG